MGEDILSVIFLALICIVVSGIAMSMLPKEMMVPTFVLIAVCLWVALDYMLIQRHKAIAACNNAPIEREHIDEQIKQLTDSLEEENQPDDKPDTNPNSDLDLEPNPLTPELKHKNEFDILMYDKGFSTEQLFKDSGCAGDTKLANRMKYMGLQARMSQDIRSKWNAEKYRPYVEEELRDGEARDWWDTEAGFLDSFM